MKRQVELTKVERWILSNQYQILGMLADEQDKEGYASCRDALDRGYIIEYNKLAEHISDVEFSRKQSSEAIDILTMFRELASTYERIPDKAGISEALLRFDGYDYNDNTERQYAQFTEYWCKHGSFQPVLGGRMKDASNFNSHRPMLAVYRHMLKAWRPIQRKYSRSTNLCKPYTREDIVQYIEACHQTGSQEKKNSRMRSRQSLLKTGKPRLILVKTDKDK